MNVKNAFCIILLFLVLFSAIAVVSADDDKSYSINQAFIELNVENNGLLHVDEIYDYTFHGTYNGIYRDIPLKEGESIENVTVDTKGAYSVVEVTQEDGIAHIKVYLYADEAHTQKISNAQVYAYISYDMKNTVTIFNDVAGLQYKLWGEEWDVGIDALTAIVHLPGNASNEYYLNPQEYNATSYLKGNTITLTSNQIPKGEFYELLVLMPTTDFENATYAKHVNENGKDSITHNLEDSANGRSFWNTTYIILGLLSLITPIIGVIVYFRLGREPKVDYDGIYEREPPTNDPPAVVNALIDNSYDIGTPNMKGFEATILNLIDKNVIGLKTKLDPNTDMNELLLKLNKHYDENLAIHENTVLDILSMFAEDDLINLSNLNSDLSYESNAKLFMEEFRIWQQDVKHEYLDSDNLKTYFNSKGASIMKKFAVFGLAAGIIIFSLGLITNLNNGVFAIGGGIVLTIFSLIVFMLPEDIFGQWTKKGRVYYLKWKNFKKFLKDNSLIEEHPPESIVVWKKYLIYGASLGVADNVYKSMKLHEKNISDYDDNIFLYHHFGGYYMMHHAFETGQTTANPSSDSGSFGNIGGGSGGGGGGAF
ncbi:MAG: DUF2207 domain-containing protein [Methanobrevibacter sp.]|uniref:DUF2207 domain-containing protein n=1 Tax=Methanobrevibacter sp. TaxID=66852 RepID=UPI0025F5DBA7|nr:DUF2207 domain-containing protein [Methanobrevibacter sp.]MBQ6098803.1 DUF2207 domain-containing protein [Methanobrevibacter sp.]